MTDFKNYTLGRGRVFFSRFLPGTQVPEGFLYIGNTPEFNLTIESEDLPHYSSDEGIREKDDGVTLEVTRTGTMITDNINPENVALFFFGENVLIATAATSGITVTQANVIPGRHYMVGATPANPMGYRGIDPANFDVVQAGGVKATGSITLSNAGSDGDTITIGSRTYTLKTAAPSAADEIKIGGSAAATASNIAAAINAGVGSGTLYGAGTTANTDVSAALAGATVNLTALASGTGGNSIALSKSGTGIAVSGSTLSGGSATGVTYDVDVDYTLDADTGRLTILEGGAINAGDDLDITFATLANTQEAVISGTSAVEGALQYIANNPKGKNFDYMMGYVNIRPNGDYSLKGDEWQQIPFTIDILKPRAAAAILMNGRPKYI